MKNYIKPQANITMFASDNVITASGDSTPVVNPEALVKSGYSIGAIKSLFK